MRHRPGFPLARLLVLAVSAPLTVGEPPLSPRNELRFHLYWNAWRNDRSSWMIDNELRRRSDRKRIRDEDWSIEVDEVRLVEDAANVDLPTRFASSDDGNPDLADQPARRFPAGRRDRTVARSLDVSALALASYSFVAPGAGQASWSGVVLALAVGQLFLLIRMTLRLTGRCSGFWPRTGATYMLRASLRGTRAWKPRKPRNQERKRTRP